MIVALKKYDWVIFGTIILLVAVSLAMLFSTTSKTSLFSSRLIRQTASFGVALVGYTIFSLWPYHSLKRYALILYGLGITSLIIIGQVAPVIRGTTSRLNFWGIQVQPSEFMKIALIISLSWLFAKFGVNKQSFLISGFLVGTTALFIILEPDIGEAALIILLWAIFIVFLGLPWRTIGLLALISIIGFAVAWSWLFADYQKDRLLTFLDPTHDPLGAGYNVTQSIVALGSGGFMGRGLGHGPQSQLKFLPEQHTDFILASAGEELGFVGVALIIILYATLLWRILNIALSTKDPFGQYLAILVFILLLVSFFISAGMNMGLLPVTGVPLPLVSYGGSNLVGTILLLGIVQSVRLHSHWLRRSPTEISDFGPSS